MANEQNTTLNSELFTALLGDAQFAAYENSVARQVVTALDYPANAGKVLQIPVYASISAADLTEGTAATAANTNTTSASLTLAEIGTYFQVTDMLRDSAQRDVIGDLGFQAGRAIAEKMDTGVFANFSSFDEIKSNVNAEVTVDDILKGVSELRSRKLTGPFYCILHPGVAYQIKKELSNAGAATIPALSNAGNTVLSQFYVGQLAGCVIIESALVATSGNNAVNGIFTPSALAHAMRGGVRMETQRQAAARATDIMMTAVQGSAILNQTFGVKLTGNKVI
jgi:N4-gp56 family major capsid protein